MGYLHSMAFGLRGYLRRLATHPGISYAGRPMAHWRHYFWGYFLHDRSDPLIRL